MEFLQFTNSGGEEPQTRFIECRAKDDKLIRFTANDIVDQVNRKLLGKQCEQVDTHTNTAVNRSESNSVEWSR